MNDYRSTVPAGKDTIRTRIIAEILRVLAVAPFEEEYPEGTPEYRKLFDISKRGNLEDLSARETPAAAVEEGNEETTENIYQLTDKRLRLYIHFKVVKVQGVDPEPLINYYFGRIAQLFVTTTTHFADLAMDIAEAGNSIQINGSTDNEPGGTIYFDVDYRHQRGNMFEE